MISVLHKGQAFGNRHSAEKKSKFTQFVWAVIMQLGSLFLASWQCNSVVML